MCSVLSVFGCGGVGGWVGRLAFGSDESKPVE